MKIDLFCAAFFVLVLSSNIESKKMQTMKTIKLSFIKITAALLFITVAISACKKGPETPPKKNCEYGGYFEEMSGYDGYYGNYIIRLENGIILYPCIVEDKGLNRNDIYDGMPITVSYRQISNEEIACQIPYNNQHDETNILPGGCFEFVKAKITCIGDARAIDAEPQHGWCGTE